MVIEGSVNNSFDESREFYYVASIYFRDNIPVLRRFREWVAGLGELSASALLLALLLGRWDPFRMWWSSGTGLCWDLLFRDSGHLAASASEDDWLSKDPASGTVSLAVVDSSFSDDILKNLHRLTRGRTASAKEIWKYNNIAKETIR